jgi:FKBP-type peptidyl-prolyl cis-trans isomerase SlyD
MFTVTVLDERAATEDEAATGQVGGGEHCEDGSCGCSH